MADLFSLLGSTKNTETGNVMKLRTLHHQGFWHLLRRFQGEAMRFQNDNSSFARCAET